MSENIRKMIFSFSFEIGSRGKSVDSTDFSESWFLVGGQLSMLAGRMFLANDDNCHSHDLQPVWVAAKKILPALKETVSAVPSIIT